MYYPPSLYEIGPYYTSSYIVWERSHLKQIVPFSKHSVNNFVYFLLISDIMTFSALLSLRRSTQKNNNELLSEQAVEQNHVTSLYCSTELIQGPFWVWNLLIGWAHTQNDSWCTWWRHQIKTFSALLAICAGNSPVTGEFTSERPVTGCFDVFLIYVWTNGWANNRNTGDLRCHCAHYDVTVMYTDGYLPQRGPQALPVHPRYLQDRLLHRGSVLCASVGRNNISLWRHQMETFSALRAFCDGNPPVTGGFPSQRPVTRSFGVYVFFNLRMNKPRSKLWRHCNFVDDILRYIYLRSCLSNWFKFNWNWFLGVSFKIR